MRKLRNDKFYISPKIIIPVYQQLRGDQVFGEANKLKMVKWFHGIGLSLSV